ncbi:MAG: hypothetical protein KF897_17480 [Opitutaceae bacterium]|nr:hypothetical protein [Opitutaceae bacterium]
MPTDPPDPLDALLDRRGAAPPPEGIARTAWRRIALLEHAEPPHPGVLLDGWFARWPFATLFLVSCALVGLFLAEARISQRERERSEQLARSYLVLINPLLQAPAGPPKP